MGQNSGRILMTTDTIGGVWTFTIELARALTQRGNEIWLVALGGLPTPAQRKEADSIQRVRLFTSEYKLEWMPDPWADIAAASDWLRSLERQCKPDLIHLNSFGHASVLWNAPTILTAHSCVASWWRAVRGSVPGPEWNRYLHEVTAALNCADVVSVPSRAMASALEANYEFDVAKVRVIPNGITMDAVQPGRKESFILAAGRLWDHAKNIQQLARVAPHLDWPVYLAGATQSTNGDEAEPSGCRCLGPLPADELAKWLSRAAIYCLPARYEPFGLSILEAAHAGCALVLGDIPSLRENWDGAALFVPPDEPEALRRALMELMANPAWRDFMAVRARRRARLFHVERMAESYAALYHDVYETRLTCAL